MVTVKGLNGKKGTNLRVQVSNVGFARQVCSLLGMHCCLQLKDLPQYEILKPSLLARIYGSKQCLHGVTSGYRMVSKGVWFAYCVHAHSWNCILLFHYSAFSSIPETVSKKMASPILTDP